MPRTIDAHIHLWRYNAEEYPWLDGPLAPLRRDFAPPELAPAMAEASIDAAIAVEARHSLAETHLLLDLAAKHPFFQGVVGWAPLTDPAIHEILETLRANPLFKGVRHRLQGEPDPAFLLHEDFNRGIAALEGLPFDLLIAEHQLPRVIPFVDRHPNQLFILDHLAKPRVAEAILEPWATHLRDLARRPNVVCKLSGLVTEAGPIWTPAQLTPYLDLAVEAFTPKRLLAASDWPVSSAGISYGSWFQLLRDHFAAYTATEQAAIFGENVAAVYSIN